MQRSVKYLHLVAFDVPYPADYGGVIDIYYKLKALKSCGIKVILHCYQYGRVEQKQLKKYCEAVYYYPRRTLKNPFYGPLPYIVRSRNTSELLQRLNKDDYPILFEGLHCTYYLNHPELKHRFKIVRTHNVEHNYYAYLEKSESKYFKKYFFRTESERLKKYESVLRHADLIAAISREDSRHFSTKYGKTIYLPAFHSNEHPEYNQLSGDYILYHGNLAVSENYEAAMELIQEVFSRLEFPCIIAGNNPPRELQRLVERFDHIRLITKTTTEELHELIAVARINVLHTNQDTGIKLKLINALYRGKHVVANRVMVANTGLESLCIVGEDLNQIRLACKEYYHQPFERESYKERIKTLNEEFENKKSALKILDHIPSEISESLKKGHGKIKRTTLFSSLRSFFLP